MSEQAVPMETEATPQQLLQQQAAQAMAAGKSGGAQEEVKQAESTEGAQQPTSTSELDRARGVFREKGAPAHELAIDLESGGAAAVGSTQRPKPHITAASRADAKRMLQRHQEYVQSQQLLARLPDLFPDWSIGAVNPILLYLAKLPVEAIRSQQGEMLTVSVDDKMVDAYQKMIKHNMASLPVVDSLGVYSSVLDLPCVISHVLQSAGLLTGAKSPSQIAIESVSSKPAGPGDVIMSDANIAASAKVQSGADAECKIEQLAASGSESATIGTVAGIKAEIEPTGPVTVPTQPLPQGKEAVFKQTGGEGHFASAAFRDTTVKQALQTITERTLASSFPATLAGYCGVLALSPDVQSPPLLQGSSTLFAMECCARFGLKHMPIVDSDQRVLGLMSETKLLDLAWECAQGLPPLRNMRVADMIPMLSPHRLIVIPEQAQAAQAFITCIQERVRGGAIVDDNGVLVDVLSPRDFCLIGADGANFAALWSSVKEYKERVRQQFEGKFPPRGGVKWVTHEQTLGDVIDIMHKLHCHRVFVCDAFHKNEPRPLCAITPRDVGRMTLLAMGLSLQGEAHGTTV